MNASDGWNYEVDDVSMRALRVSAGALGLTITKLGDGAWVLANTPNTSEQTNKTLPIFRSGPFCRFTLRAGCAAVPYIKSCNHGVI
jgi:hypothetical protein